MYPHIFFYLSTETDNFPKLSFVYLRFVNTQTVHSGQKLHSPKSDRPM